jgi:hypothetical protein
VFALAPYLGDREPMLVRRQWLAPDQWLLLQHHINHLVPEWWGVQTLAEATAVKIQEAP